MIEITNYGNSLSSDAWIREASYKLNKNLKVGIINWWWLDKNQENIETISSFVDSQDICFFVSEEIYFKYSDVNINELFSVLNNKNVYYIMMSEDYALLTPPFMSKCYYIPWFFKSRLYIDKNLKIDVDFRTKKYDFNFLPGSKKSNRTLLYKLLKDNNHIYSSYYGHPTFKYTSNTELESPEQHEALINQDVTTEKLDTMVFLAKEGKNYTLSHIIPTNIYNNTHFDIVCETYIRDQHQFLTEKTAKPIATGRLFYWYSSPGMVSYLEKYGFSFSTYPGSHYDQYSDHVIRLDALVESIEQVAGNTERIKQLYKETKDERIHNKNVYENCTNNFFDDLYKWIRQVVENA